MGKVGVVIGRFQVADLHQGHLDIFKRAISENGKLLVILGNSHLIHTRRDPLDYPTRLKMIQSHFPEAIVSFVKNRETNEQWSKDIDKLIHDIFPNDIAILYGGRDSFIPCYSGKHECVEVHSYNVESGTQIRNRLETEILSTPDFRQGIIYSAMNRFPRLNGTVDIALVDPDNKTIALGKKPQEISWRFFGGFVDIRDESYEMAAKRELSEECPGIEVGNWYSLGSCRVEDWRYAGVEDSEYIMTSFFYCEKLFGTSNGGDDIGSVKWFPIEDLKNNNIPLIKCHEILRDKFVSFIWEEPKFGHAEGLKGRFE